VSRSLPVTGGAGMLEVPGGRVRVLMVISRPGWDGRTWGYRMVARPLLERLDVVRGEVDLTVLRPPTFQRAAPGGEAGGRGWAAVSCGAFRRARGDARQICGWRGGGGARRPRPDSGEGQLAFELPGGGRCPCGGRPRWRRCLAEGQVPVVVLNACHSGAVGKELEASVATATAEGRVRGGGSDGLQRVCGPPRPEFMAAFLRVLVRRSQCGAGG